MKFIIETEDTNEAHNMLNSTAMYEALFELYNNTFRSLAKTDQTLTGDEIVRKIREEIDAHINFEL